jgi:hypothetical protein
MQFAARRADRKGSAQLALARSVRVGQALPLFVGPGIWYGFHAPQFSTGHARRQAAARFMQWIDTPSNPAKTGV